MADALTWIARSGVVQGVILGAVLAFLTATVILNIAAKALTRTANGWSSMPKAGRPGNGILMRAASAKALPAVNVFEEAAYWTTTRDDSGQTLRGGQRYVLSFPAGRLPPNDAFWSLTLTDAVGYMVSNPLHRSSIDDLSPLVENADGSIDIYLQDDAPDGREQNWLPTPPGRFKLWLRAYLPGAAVLDGSYRVPPVVKAR